MSDTAVVLYHAHCADGFGAAYAAWKALGDSAVYVPVQYGQPYPPELDGGVRELYLLDFSYPLETMKRLQQVASQVAVIDHHASAEEPLKEWNRSLPFCGRGSCHHVVFDLDQSGAVLAWEYFHHGKPVPELLFYVQDRDLWRWELPDSRAVSAGLRSRPMEFQEWDRLSVEELIPEGRAILRYQDEQVKAHTRNAALQDVGGYQVPVVNATTLMSEIGEALCQQFPDAPFSATYFVRRDGKRVWSLRSRNGFDVSTVAKAKAGGGHKAAAGFEE